MSKYIDLAETIHEGTRFNRVQPALILIRSVLNWLDEHPDQVPGRTITESEFQELMEDVTTSYQVGFTDGLYRAGGRVVPDPEPTNSEKWKDLLLRAVKDSGDWNARTLSETLDGYGLIAPGGDEAESTEHDLTWWIENANVNDAEDCEACEGDLCPVHYGISMGIDLMARKIAALGDDPELFALIPDPVKAPDNE